MLSSKMASSKSIIHKDPKFVSGFFGKILRASTIHGVKYIGATNRHILERLYWTIAVLILIGYSIYLAVKVYLKFNENPVIISLQPKATDISQIPFPAITLCNANILKRRKIETIFEGLEEEVALYRLQDSVELSENLIRMMVLSEHLAHYCLAAPSFKRLIGLVDSQDLVTQIQEFLELSRNTDSADGSFMTSDSQLSDVLRYNLSMFGFEAAHRCEDMIKKCMWEGKVRDCSEMFVPILTQRGMCCVFNMMPRFILRNIPENESRAEVAHEKKSLTEEDIDEWRNFGKNGKVIDFDDESIESDNPRHQKAGGRPYGLSILVNPEFNKYGTCSANDAWGFKILAHSPISFPNIMDYGTVIPPKSEVFIDVEPMLSIADDSLQSIDIEKRGCYFPTEDKAKLKSYKFYSAMNCLDECIARITYENCSCVRYYMPRNSSQTLCGAKKLECAEEVRVNISSSGRSGFCSHCLPACTELTYRMQLSHFSLKERYASMPCIQHSEGFDEKKENSLSIVHVYIGMQKIHAKERKRLYDASDLLANAGGLLSLTLGFSIASVVEIFYFCTFRAWFHFHEKDDDDKENNQSDASNDSSGKRKKDNRKSSDVDDKMAIEYYDWTNKKKGNVKKEYPTKVTPRQKTPKFHLLAGNRHKEDPPPPYSFLY